MLIISIGVIITSKGPALYWSDRVGKNNKIFPMPKFRTMLIETPQVATHLLSDSKTFLTPIGSFLRKTSLDELPQLWSILLGHMSFVGPRPALYNQNDLIELRTKYNIHLVIPGLTGWAQVNGRDDLDIVKKVELDKLYVEKQSFFFDLKIIFITFSIVIFKKGISH